MGLFVKPLAAKNSCSPAEKVKGALQSVQVRVSSVYIGGLQASIGMNEDSAMYLDEPTGHDSYSQPDDATPLVVPARPL